MLLTSEVSKYTKAYV